MSSTPEQARRRNAAWGTAAAVVAGAAMGVGGYHLAQGSDAAALVQQAGSQGPQGFQNNQGFQNDQGLQNKGTQNGQNAPGFQGVGPMGSGNGGPVTSTHGS